MMTITTVPPTTTPIIMYVVESMPGSVVAVVVVVVVGSLNAAMPDTVTPERKFILMSQAHKSKTLNPASTLFMPID